MNNMEGGNVIILLPQYKEDRVCEFNELRDVVPPATSRHPHCDWIIRVIDRLTLERVVSTPAGNPGLRKNEIKNTDYLDEFVPSPIMCIQTTYFVE